MSTDGESRVGRREYVRTTGSARGGLVMAVSIPRLVPAGALAVGE